MSKKKIITIVSVLAVILLSVSVISYSIANRGNGGNNKISDNLAQRGAGTIESTYVTNIDLIIENSTKTPIENYNIVEIIPSSASQSSLKSYISEGLFKKYVIDENSTSDPKKAMAADAIEFDVIKVAAGTSLDEKMSSNILGAEATIREILDETDLIYLSSPSYSAYDGNMSEDIYNYLHTYTLGKNKPMIMDYVTQGSSGNTTEKTSFSYSELVKTISNNHIRFKTFAWQPDASATEFFSRDTGKGSYYITYNTNNNSVSSNVLVITKSGESGNSMYGKMKGMDSSELIDLAYYGNNKPKSIKEYKVVSPNDLTSAILDEEYDFILIENDVASDSMSKEIYTKLRSLSESGRYILYDGRLAESSGETTTPEATASNNYLKLMQLLLTNRGLAKYSHILPVSNGYFDSLNAAGDSGVEGAKAIADIINAGDYRGSGSNGTNGKVFRVLELQPCYPIDLEIAENATTDAKTAIARAFGMKGNYYLSPSDLTAGMTKDEVEAGTEYYDFDLSRAKIAKATGLNYKQIQVDQMSTNEFISKKDVVIETYDLVYIGGNTSALTPHINFGVLGGSISWEDTKNAWDYFTSFDMYTHTGLMSALRVAKNSGAGTMSEVVEAKGQTVDYPVGQLFINNEAVSTVTEYNGNDINSLKYEELNNYVTRGMPVIVEKTVADAFEEAKQAEGNRLSQLALRNIDPDSYMYRILDDIYALHEKSSVVWGLDATHHEKLDEDGNADRLYGNTLGAAVTLFDQEVNDEISAVMGAGAVRPTLAVTSMPKEYSEGNPNSYNKYADGFVISAYAKPAITSGSNEFDMSLYIDLDGNGVFSDVLERVNQKEYTYAEPEEGTAPKTVDLTYTLPENFYGIVSWKVVAKDKNTGLVSSVTGYAYYEREETAAKKEIEILQILPRSSSLKATMENAIKNNEEGDSPYNTGVTLYLCTECQMHRYRAEYNLYANNADIGRNSISTSSLHAGVNLGLHEHKFGIPQYNTNTQNEDWDSNLANVLTGPEGDYEADIDIMYADEFETLIAQIQGQSEEDIEANKILMQKAYADMETAEKDPAYINAEKKVKEYLISLQGSSNLKNSEHFKEYAEAGDYYKLWMYNLRDVQGNIDYNEKLTEYRKLYNEYVKYNDKVVQAKKDYRKYRRLAYRTDQWMANNYSIVVLGWAEDFGGEDLNDDACAMLTDYINRGGSMLNTHDSTTKYAKAGAMNLTEKLRGTFGMDRFHITGTAEGSSGSGTAEASSVIAKLDIPSYAYSAAKEELADTTYVVTMHTGRDAEVARFTIKKGGPMRDVTADVYFHVNGHPKDNWANITHSQTSQELTGSTTSKITINAYHWPDSYEGEEEDAKPADEMLVSLNKVEKTSWGGENLVPIASGKTDSNGQCVFENIEQGTEIVEAAKMTKALSNDAMVVLKDTDQSYVVNLTKDGDYSTNNSIVVGTSGAVHTDLEENLQVTFQLNFPDGLTEELKKLLETNPLTCKITHNGKTYTSDVKSDGTVTFSIPIVSSMAGGNISADSLRYRHFTTGGEQYRLTERALSENYVQWNQLMLQTTPPAIYGDQGWKWTNIRSNWDSMGYNNPIGVTDYFIMYQTDEQSTPYRYVESQTIAATTWDVGYPSKTDQAYGPLGASQVNKGIVTTYPFLISSELKIAQTHAQTYALDLDDKDVAVWYTLAPGINRTAGVSGAKTAASLYAASPHDGMNNYYLYSKGNIFYCGSGHSLVTGPKIDNNDERRLFINVIVNSVRNAAEKPKITVHRKDTDGAEVKEDKNEKLNVDGSGNYYYNVDDNEEIPEFDFRVTVDSKADLGEVYVFYDLDYGLIVDGETNSSNAYEVNDKHVLIAEYNTKSADSNALASKELAKLRKYVEEPESGYKNLQLKPEYFEVYGGNYTYIVIQATDTNGKTAYQRIKINLVPKLWELTMTEPANSRILLDVSDRVKYNI